MTKTIVTTEEAVQERQERCLSRLRKEREFSFYGDIDFIPTERYSREDAERALNDARRVVTAAELLIPAQT